MICGNSISVYLHFMPESRVLSEDNSDYPGIHHSERIVREIRKPNGDKVTIFESGSTVIHKVGKLPRTRTPEGHVWTWVEGKAVKSIPKRKRPLDEKPLNVASNSSEAIGKKLSNFAERRFVLDGKNYHSVEGWYWSRCAVVSTAFPTLPFDSKDLERQATVGDAHFFLAKGRVKN
jgi:hypothetical protein